MPLLLERLFGLCVADVFQQCVTEACCLNKVRSVPPDSLSDPKLTLKSKSQQIKCSRVGQSQTEATEAPGHTCEQA
jgi:hypothetical protein